MVIDQNDAMGGFIHIEVTGIIGEIFAVGKDREVPGIAMGMIEDVVGAALGLDLDADGVGGSGRAGNGHAAIVTDEEGPGRIGIGCGAGGAATPGRAVRRLTGRLRGLTGNPVKPLIKRLNGGKLKTGLEFIQIIAAKQAGFSEGQG